MEGSTPSTTSIELPALSGDGGLVVSLAPPANDTISAMKKFEERVASLESNMAPLQTQVASLSSDVAPIKTKLASLSCDVAPIKTKLASLQSDVAPLNGADGGPRASLGTKRCKSVH